MLKSINYISAILILSTLLACTPRGLKVHEFPIPEDTSTKEIQAQVKTSYRFDGVYADNEFDGARMNGFRQVNDSTFRVIISPENTPINASSYFSFRLRSEKQRSILLEIEYTEHEHRYVPKLSYDAVQWVEMDSTLFDTLKSPSLATLQLKLDERPLYVSAQELMCSKHNEEWIQSLVDSYADLTAYTIGKSVQGRDLWCIEIGKGDLKNKKAIAVFSRLHPPEVTGYMAMKSFVETILDSSSLSKAFRDKYRIIIYPMINPDGVDNGHWRHNAGGIDINRDWSHYRQQEPKLVARHLTKVTKENKNDVVLGIDFHSTQEDVYYTLTDNRKSSIFGFKNLWIEAIDTAFPFYSPKDEPYDLNQPITKGWFFLQFGAEGITYEVGDETDRDFVKHKAHVAAKEMMKLLVLK